MINEFYYKILNLYDSSGDISQRLKKIMEQFDKEYANINKQQMCKVFANNISNILSANNIDNRIFNTKNEFGGYEHEFVLCRGFEKNEVKYFLIDYTFVQFFSSHYYTEMINKIGANKMFGNLLKNGYVEITNDGIVKYLKVFNEYISNFDLDGYFNDLNKKYKK